MLSFCCSYFTLPSICYSLSLSLSFVCYSFGGIFFPLPLLPPFFVIIFGVSFLLCLWPPPQSLWLLHFGGCCFFFLLVAAFLLLLAFLCRSFIFVALPFLFWKWYSVARKDRLTDWLTVCLCLFKLQLTNYCLDKKNWVSGRGQKTAKNFLFLVLFWTARKKGEIYFNLAALSVFVCLSAPKKTTRNSFCW